MRFVGPVRLIDATPKTQEVQADSRVATNSCRDKGLTGELQWTNNDD